MSPKPSRINWATCVLQRNLKWFYVFLLNYSFRPIKNLVLDVTHPSTINLDISLFRFVVLECITSSPRFVFWDGGSNWHDFFFWMEEVIGMISPSLPHVSDMYSCSIQRLLFWYELSVSFLEWKLFQTIYIYRIKLTRPRIFKADFISPFGTSFFFQTR